MKHFSIIGVIVGIALLAAGCSEDRVVSPLSSQIHDEMLAGGIDPEMAAGEIVQATGWQYDPEVELPAKLDLLDDKAIHFRILDFERSLLVGDIAHYSFTLRIGAGEHDLVRLHRVVKERRPYRPIRTRKNAFAVHGLPGNFYQYFLVAAVAPSAPPDHAMAIYLAENDVDVWGIDQAYYLVPPETTDFSFMADWGLQFDVDNLRTGMAVARFTRLFTGSGFGKMTLIGMGHGGGGSTGYAALNHETQLPCYRRHIGAFIPLTSVYKTDNAAWQAFFCASAENFNQMLQAGTYQDTKGQMFSTMSSFALSDPDGASPFVPGFTNMGAIQFIVCMTWVPLQFPDQSHYFAGIFGDSGFPVDLRYSDMTVTLEATAQIPSFESVRYRYEVEAIKGDAADLPFDDYLSQITVPILAVGVGGYMGDLIEYSTTLVGSSDVTILTVQLEDDADMAIDIGLADISHAMNAEALFWQPMLQWIEDQNDRAGSDIQFADAGTE